MERRALGKGISALIPEKESPSQERIVYLKIEEIKPNPFQPRQDFDPEGMEELMQSIREKGLLQPILVRLKPDGYELIAGERRFNAAKLLNLKEIPAIIREADDLDSLELSLIENIQRQDLNPIEEARAYQYLIEKFQLTQERLSQVLGKSRASVANILRLLKLPQEVQDELRKGTISFAHGRVLLEIDDPNQQRYLTKEIISNSLSVRELENLVRRRKRRILRPRTKQIEPYIVVLEEELQHRLATRVRIIKQKKRGHINIEFYSAEDLQRIVNIIKGNL
ncbi:MAG: ParB/RepB/Spo0J family partition protein [Candidatus Omnitrophica bacterium]|nr:ParB/RepB/Spo0J family partition protein [Candidatus Omnitrophota bacterium]